MNLGKLAKRLKKELAANPKQAAVLGIGCVIAIWFWTPLVLRWMKPKPMAAPAVTAAVASNVITDPAPTPQAAAVSWRDVCNWRKADPRTRSPFGMPHRDPFAGQKKEDAVEAVAETVASDTSEETSESQGEFPEEDATISPEQLGLTVESIAYSNARRRAQISGRTFKEQDNIPLANRGALQNNAASQPACRVKAIEPTYVLVEIRGQEIRLELQQKRLAHGDLVERR